MHEIVSYGRFHCRELAPHKNRGMEITYVERGMLEWMVEGVPETVTPGSVFFTLPWQAHGGLNRREPENILWHVLFHLEDDCPDPRSNFRFPSRFGFSRDEMLLLSTAFATSSSHAFRATPAMRWLMTTLIRELQSNHELGAAHALSLLRAVIVELKRIVTGQAVDTDTHSPAEQRVQALLPVLSAQCDSQWTLHEMAAACGIRRTHLNTIFQHLTGSTPMGYLARLRIERAKTLLRETDRKIIDIALDCGANSSQYFANTFKEATGMTPSEYRRNAAGLSPGELREWRHIDFRSEQEERRRVEDFSTD